MCFNDCFSLFINKVIFGKFVRLLYKDLCKSFFFINFFFVIL